MRVLMQLQGLREGERECVVMDSIYTPAFCFAPLFFRQGYFFLVFSPTFFLHVYRERIDAWHWGSTTFKKEQGR